MRLLPRAACSTVLLASMLGATPALAQTAPPAAAMRPKPADCLSDPEYRRFDFWIGTWDVQPTGQPRAAVGATSRIEQILGSCALLENWEPPKQPAGKSFNIYNRVSRKWEQFWVDATGLLTHYTGEFRPDGNLYFEADQFGSTNKIRMTFFPQGPDQVRQLGHVSTDGGKTWTVSFDLTYVKKRGGA